MRKMHRFRSLTVALGAWTLLNLAHVEAAKQPNIVMIMGDDIGWFNIGAYPAIPRRA